MKKILVIQTASIGDVILSTPVLEKLHLFFPQSEIDVLLKKGIEGLFEEHPFIHNIYIWDKRNHKYKNWYQLLKQFRQNKYDLIVNLQRFGSTGLLTVLSNAKQTVGFDKNPFSAFYSKRYPHLLGQKGKPYKHEVERNLSLIESFTDNSLVKPKLYPTPKHFEKVLPLKAENFCCIAPASLWFTKQYPKEKWIEFLQSEALQHTRFYLLGGQADEDLCQQIIEKSQHPLTLNLAGKLSLLETAALMQNAQMNYVNDSAPMHLASSMNANTTAIFCSTIPEFGFGPLADNSTIVEIQETLDCRPCGLHGYRECPQKHFKCALSIELKAIE